MIIKLLHEFCSNYGTPTISSVDSTIFTETYFTYCLKCNFCDDSCCEVGTDIDLENLERIGKWIDALELFVGLTKTQWFEEGVRPYAEYPSRAFVRTKIINESCVFLNQQGRGCLLHSFSVKQNIDYHLLKPIICCIFPITFDNGLLHPAVEVEDNSLRCLGKGETLYLGVRSELFYYFGAELINELDEYQKIFLNNKTM